MWKCPIPEEQWNIMELSRTANPRFLLLSVVDFEVVKAHTFLWGAKFLRMLIAVEEGCVRREHKDRWRVRKL